MPGDQVLWYAKPGALLAWGIITAVGAVLDQWANPGKRAEDHLLYKVALRAIEAAVRWQNLDIEKATKLWNSARINPEVALRALAGQPEAEHT